MSQDIVRLYYES